jgi:hypothetical protein
MRVDTADDSPCQVEPVGKLVFGKWASHLLWALAHHARRSANRDHEDADRAVIGSGRQRDRSDRLPDGCSAVSAE